MTWARVAGQDIYFSVPLPELGFIQVNRTRPESLVVPPPQALIRRARGWLAGERREIEIWSSSPGLLIRVKGGRDIYIPSRGDLIIQTQGTKNVTPLETETLLGPALLLALALHGTWCLHASAAMFNGRAFVFLGESGRGKSTLAAFLARTREWAWVADDILPFTVTSQDVHVWPRFPQLKVSAEAQPGLFLPEKIPVSRFFLLKDSQKSTSSPIINLMKQGQALQSLVAHTASTRLFDEDLLSNHLKACAAVASQLPVFELIYPRQMESLPHIKELLETSW